jgi:hypothetical protein
MDRQTETGRSMCGAWQQTSPPHLPNARLALELALSKLHRTNNPNVRFSASAATARAT